MKMVKKLVAVVAALTLTIGMVSTAMAATWSSYFGLNKGWYEGMKATMTSNSATGWTVKATDLGWGGCWGGQVYQKGISIKKGQQYTLKFTLKSSKMPKYVWVKIGDESGKKLNFGGIFHYMYGQGYYDNQHTAYLNGTGWVSYVPAAMPPYPSSCGDSPQHRDLASHHRQSSCPHRRSRCSGKEDEGCCTERQ